MSKKPTTEFAVRLSCNIATSPGKAFEAFTEPERLSSWFSKSAESDLRVGGLYSNSEGDKGEYLAIDRPSHLRFTWDNAEHCPGTLVEVRFLEAGACTRVELLHSRIADLEGHDDMREGWRWAFASLKSYLETGNPIPFETWLEEQAKAKIQPREKSKGKGA